MKHELKILPVYFDLQLAGLKDWELRKNDRGYQVGDILVLNEWTGKEYTGRKMKAEVIFIFKSKNILEDDCVILSTKRLEKIET